ncbi:MAG: hypothetical protein IJQ78_07005 [Selenomonadaceae bacterium]|nr:hypothetical protein [Selenomonadaceae bacterium]
MRNCIYSEVTGLRPLQGCVRFQTDRKATMTDAIMVAFLWWCARRRNVSDGESPENNRNLSL